MVYCFEFLLERAYFSAEELIGKLPLLHTLYQVVNDIPTLLGFF